jgi:PAS domain S-box-containing protein
MENPEVEVYELYRDLQAYVGWTSDDAARIKQLAAFVRERMSLLIDDFYAEIERHPEAARVITGGKPQVERLKASLRDWLSESLDCRNDADYVLRRWRIGFRHAEIGLNPAYASSALSRLRNGLISLVAERDHDSPRTACELVKSFNKLLDVDLAIIQDAYQAEYTKREKQAEHERSEVKFRMLVEAAGCMVVILRPHHSIAYFSPYSEELTAYSAAEVADQDFLGLFIPDWARDDVAQALTATLTGPPTTAYEAPLLCRDGTQKWIVWNARRLDQFEHGPAVLAVGQDLTAWRHAQDRLLRTERLAGIGQMVTGIAHESRNALQRIQSSSEMLELQVNENEKALSHVRRIQEAQEDLHRLLEEVRSFAAPIQLEREPCRLDATWQQAWDSLETARRGRDALLTAQTNSVDLTIPVDRFRLIQLFRNLFENSLAACRDPLRLEIACSDSQLHQQSAVEIRTCDNGPGLTPNARRSVFEPFFTTKTKGTGLGMAIARRIVDAHGGRIAVGDESHPGAEFVVTLPRVAL